MGLNSAFKGLIKSVPAVYNYTKHFASSMLSTKFSFEFSFRCTSLTS